MADISHIMLNGTSYDVADASARSAITTINDNIDTLFDENISHRNFILLGDSFGRGVTPNVSSVNWHGWIYWVKQYLTTYTNCAVYDSENLIAEGNTGFASSLPFLDHLTYIANNLTDEEKYKVTDIVVLGGTNDVSVIANVEAAIMNFMSYVKTNFPNAQVKIGCIGSKCMTFKNTVEPYYRTCEKYGASYLHDTIGLMGLREYISSDSVHLTQAGYAFYSQYVLEAVLTGKTHFEFSVGCYCNLRNSSSFNTYQPILCTIAISEDNVNVKFYNETTTPNFLTDIEVKDSDASNVAFMKDVARVNIAVAPRVCVWGGRFDGTPAIAIKGLNGHIGNYECKPVAFCSYALGGTEDALSLYQCRSAPFIVLDSNLISGLVASSLRTVIPYTDINMKY